MKQAILVTGACINTGVSIVEAFANAGWNVVFTGRESDNVSAQEQAYRTRFPQVEIWGYPLEALTDSQTVNTTGVDALFAKLDKGGIFVKALVLNAADQGLGIKVWENPLEDFQRVLNTNVSWNYYLIEQATKRMKEQKEGSIVFINSNTAYRAIPHRIAYETSKSAQLGMMRGLALDLGPYHIRVNAVLPGMIRTNRWVENPEFYKSVPSRFTPLGDVANGSDIADAVMYFVSHARNTTGAELTVDGGNTVQLYPIIPTHQ